MVAIQIRDVPAELHEALARDAQAHGQSLQAYLRDVLERQGMAARNAEFLRTWSPARSAAGDSVDIVALIAQERLERDRRAIGDPFDDATG